MSLTRSILKGPDRKISSLCHRGAHEGGEQKHQCKGRSCTCDCHPINLKTPFCIICDKIRTDKPDEKCRYCTGEKQR